MGFRTGIGALGVSCVLSCVLAVAGCGGGQSADQLMNRSFTTTSVVTSGEERPLAADSTLKVTFTPDGVSAVAGCNTMFGPVSFDSGTLRTSGPLGMTMMGCDPALMDQDQWISEFLASGPTWKLDGPNLTLASGETVLVLKDSADA